MKYTVYKVTNTINNKIYIGAHKTEDLDDNYLGSGVAIQNAVKKHGKENFTKEILYILPTEEEMYLTESQIVTEEFIQSRDNYNISVGGYGGFAPYASQRGTDKLLWLLENDSDFKKIQTDYARAGNQKVQEMYPEGTFKGKTHTEESKQKQREIFKEIGHQKGSSNSQYGFKTIHHPELKQGKKIKKEELNFWIKQGWKLGRLSTYLKRQSNED